jgi:signal transduction histidine kinase
MFLNSLSGRFLLLTMIFVMLAEVLIFVPSVARYREDYIRSRLERAQIASLSLLAAGDMIDEKVEKELLANAEVYNVVLRRDEMRQLVLSSPIPQEIEATYDMRDPPAWTLIKDAIHCLLEPKNRIIRVIGDPVKQAGLLIEATMDTAPLQKAMIKYGVRILGLSAVISLMTALLLFLAVRRLLVVPIRRVVTNMASYADAPEDARRFIVPQSSVVELHEAEEALQSMQRQLTGALKQKDRLAQLGGAVARISHDLRNILTTAQLLADRMETSKDPGVARAAPKLVASISRAVSLCESTLTFGKAEEPPPTLTRFMLASLAADVVDGEKLAGTDLVDFVTDVPPSFTIRGDREQLYRVISNLVRNARQAIEATGQPGTIEIGAGEEEGGWWIRIGDTGPGLPQKTREHLFEPFHAGNRKGGTGLGLAIAAELIRGHGGRLDLVRSDEHGTEFMAHIPRELGELEQAAQ